MAVSKRLRYEVLRRDEFTCRYCGRAAPDVLLAVDHVIPRSLGGTDEPGNLVAACVDCNSGKAASNPDAPLVAEVDEKATQWAQAMRVAIERRGAELEKDRERTAAFEAEWTAWASKGGEIPRDANWRNSVLRFLAAGLTDDFLIQAIHTAVGNSRVPPSETWRYFCGICWREINRIQTLAREIHEQGAATSSTAAAQSEPKFDYMSIFDDFLEGIVRALGGDEQVQKFASWELWNAMPEAHRAWTTAIQSGVEPGEDESLEIIALDAAREEMSSVAARGMWEIQQRREARERANGS